MKVIALLGASNSGKSHAINVTYHILLRDGYTQVPGYFRVLGNPVFEDAFDVLEKGGKKVGVIGMADYIKGPNSLKTFLQQMLVIGCDVVICACRDNPKIEAAVKAYAGHVFVPKTISTGRDNDRIVNVADADALLSYV